MARVGGALRAILDPVFPVSRGLLSLAFVLCFAPLGCRGQSAAATSASGVASTSLTPELTRRIEVLIRSRSNVPPNYTIAIGPETKSDVPGYKQVSVSFSADGKESKPVNFLVSDDGKTLAQFSRYDISGDPKQLISDAGRPGRGGPASAPITIVGFDDLECPFCARLHAQMFPALLARYGDKVHFVYKDFPLPMHPWAMRAAIDTNCLGAQSVPGYWNVVDHIHEHAGELGGAEKSLAAANNALDTIVRDEGAKQKVDAAKLNACLLKQDDSAVQASMKEGDALGLSATPVLFINGEKFEGAYPVADLYRMIDEALIAQGKTPPPAPATTVQTGPAAPTAAGSSKPAS